MFSYLGILFSLSFLSGRGDVEHHCRHSFGSFSRASCCCEWFKFGEKKTSSSWICISCVVSGVWNVMPAIKSGSLTSWAFSLKYHNKLVRSLGLKSASIFHTVHLGSHIFVSLVFFSTEKINVWLKPFWKKNAGKLTINSELLNAVFGCLVGSNLWLQLSLLGLICNLFSVTYLFHSLLMLK